MKPKLLLLLGALLAAALPPATAAVSKSDQTFVTRAAQGGMAEIALGKVAAAQGGSEAVKSFGAMMVTQHGQAGAELAAIAKEVGAKMPSALNKKNAEAVKDLTPLTGAAFDDRYVTMMVTGHQRALAQFQAAAKTLQNPALKAFAEKTIPMIQMHLEKIRAIKQGLVPKPA